jgi:hypothetical protein
MSRPLSLPRKASHDERLFAAYLNQMGLSAEYEPDIGDSLPDFLVDLPVGEQLIVEVYEPEEKASPGGGWRNPAQAANKLFRSKRKAKQISAAYNVGLPVLCVLGESNSDFNFDPFEIAIAMLGLDAPLRSGKFSDISAIGVVRRFNPTAWRLERSVAERLGSRAECVPSQNWAVAFREAESELSRTGCYRPDASLAYLSVLMNPFADYSFNFAALEGPHDERWNRSGKASPIWFDRVWTGPAVSQRGCDGAG